MSLSIDKLKAKLNTLEGKNNKSTALWKPNPGKQEVRIIPYKFNKEDPFISLQFHYNLNGKTYLSPATFGRRDPIVEFANSLKKTGVKEDWLMARKIEPKVRTYVPVIVRGIEVEGVKFWGFGKTVYKDLLTYATDGEYGDITDLVNGRDIIVEFKTAAETKATYPSTSVRPKLKTSPAVDPSNVALLKKLDEQINILELFPEPTYEELKEMMEDYVNPENVNSPLNNKKNTPVDSNDDPDQNATAAIPTNKPVTATTAPATIANVADTKSAEQVFTELFKQ